MPNNPEPLTLPALQEAVKGSAAAFCCRRRLRPAGGHGDKVFPPTFAGGVYAVEQRRIEGRPEPVTCVVLDTVQSQANRMELALQEALDAGRIQIPVIQVDFSAWSPAGSKPKKKKLIDDVGVITSLQVPHRLADAILRDSQTKDGTPFRESEYGKELNNVSQRNATALYKLCPTALLFGMWDSTGPKGGLGAKFERAIVSEIVGIGASFGVRTVSRIDPLITKTEGIVFYEKADGTWTLAPKHAKKDGNNNPILLRKKGRASEANLGNVTPAFAKYTKAAEGLDPLKAEPFTADYRLSVGRDSLEIRHRATTREDEAREGRIAAGGVTLEYAEQVTTLSLIVLRRLRFPIPPRNGETEEAHKERCAEADAAARTVLAALGLCAATLAFENGAGLRSRCLLWPEEPMTWKLLAKPGDEPQRFTLTSADAVKLLKTAVESAGQAGLAWNAEPVRLQPQPKLVELVRRSQKLAVQSGPEETGD